MFDPHRHVYEPHKYLSKPRIHTVQSFSIKLIGFNKYIQIVTHEAADMSSTTLPELPIPHQSTRTAYCK